MIRADLARCRGAGQCVFVAPDLFDQDDEEGKVVILDPEPAPERAAAVGRAVRACPNAVLSAD